MTILSFVDLLALLWFFLCWFGYHFVSRYRARKIDRLQNALRRHMESWAEVLHKRDVRMVDTSVVLNLERNATFLASSCLLIIAGLLTVMGSADRAVTLVAEVPFVSEASAQSWEVKLLVLTLIFVYAFFTFTWCMRQYGFISILIGNAPLSNDASVTEEERARHKATMARLSGLAVYSFNLGLRSYYFSLALLAWFIHPLAFAIATAWVVGVLYRRDFHSKTLKSLSDGLS